MPVRTSGGLLLLKLLVGTTLMCIHGAVSGKPYRRSPLEEKVRAKIQRGEGYDPKFYETFGIIDKDEFNYNDIITVTGSLEPTLVSDNTMNAVQIQQDAILAEIVRRYPDAIKIASACKLVNVVFVQIPDMHLYEGIVILDDIDEVYQVQAHATYHMDLNQTVSHIQGFQARQKYCATGRGVKVAVLDSGVDYTHAQMGGSGTREAYESAYGTRSTSPRNRRRNGMFPTNRIYDGFDFIGNDNDPIDFRNGHGTFVTSNVVAVAPEAQIMALTVCNPSNCPEFAVLLAFEYAIDPNNDGNTDDKVDIINLSLGTSLPAYYSPVSRAAEVAFAEGVLVVASAGNDSNLPFITGGFSTSYNVLSVGATGHPSSPFPGTTEFYSSRGPGDNNQLKPDISAPSGSLAAAAGSGTFYRRVFGTSFSAPVIAGAAALLKEKCPQCSPFAIKALLMNNAFRIPSTPLSWMGAGEVQINNALEADFWAYSPDDGNKQPSISLGVINAALDSTFLRNIRVHSLGNAADKLELFVKWQDPSDEATGAVTISFSSSTLQLDGCNSQKDVSIVFAIKASNAPNNCMTSRRDPTALNKNEFDGHILIRSKETGKTIGVPFHMILRKASKVSLSRTTFNLGAFQRSADLEVELTNIGNGVAQVDAFQLLFLSGDIPEGAFGSTVFPADIRSVGYRSLPVDNVGCTTMIEFVVTYWERLQHVVPTFIEVWFDLGEDRTVRLIVASSLSLEVSESYVIDDDGNIACTGFPADHGIDSSNVIFRACTEQLGIPPSGVISAFLRTFALPVGNVVSDLTTEFVLNIRSNDFSAPSRNIVPGETSVMPVRFIQGLSDELGIKLVTNAFRDDTNTGAATRETETLYFTRNGVSLPQEVTFDQLIFPDAQFFQGPTCEWRQDACNLSPKSISPTRSPVMLTDFPTIWQPQQPVGVIPSVETNTPSCPPNEVPRSPIPPNAPFRPVGPGTPDTGGESSGFGCFDGKSLVQTRHQGLVALEQVGLGDEVLVSSGGQYEPIFSFGHKRPTAAGRFVQVRTDSNATLILTQDHMVFLIGHGFVTAGQLEMGDFVVVGSGPERVEHIQMVQGLGMFAPFTPSGTILVNGVLVSCYISFESRLTDTGNMIPSFHWFAHALLFPYRVAYYYANRCMYSMPFRKNCTTMSSGFLTVDDESYSEIGVSTRIEPWLKASLTILEVNNRCIKISCFILLIILALSFWCIEQALFLVETAASTFDFSSRFFFMMNILWAAAIIALVRRRMRCHWKERF